MRLRTLACRVASVGARGSVQRALRGAAKLLAAGLFASGAAWASTPAPDSEHRHHVAPVTSRRLVDYSVPAVALVREDGKAVSLDRELQDGRPVVVSFVYTTCTTICPVTSMTLAELQARLGGERDQVRLMSISIDPEQDTPARLRAYAERFNAGTEWHHYTGTVEASIAAQRAFDVYRGDKMSHAPVTLVRPSRGASWVRLEGFATADQLLAELRPSVRAGHLAADDDSGQAASQTR